jgi:hypothetical protein
VQNRKRDAMRLLMHRISVIVVSSLLALPGFMLTYPLIAIADFIAKRKRMEALAGSDVKLKGFVFACMPLLVLYQHWFFSAFV